ncbi:unnamed protein product [Vitrella brassicaformis CCMP3155]|uniref:Ankyrin repeat domain-containing protein n=1 Tax=Vitrella brassicaformis (strain CCMP3155) TaxID=1169540 RepID=A0A0G4ENI9_VITBC|nr:unnamed protein product [Vitrella brassicaformis CCMP3155]|eukprot:CEL99423.1 unnamed protein product [Vitrella brassicaformis CCMP3155]
MRQRFYDFFGVRGYQEGTADALVAVKTLLDGGADPNMAFGEPLYRAVMAETATDDSDRLLVWDADARDRIFSTVELLLEAGADPNLGTRRLAGGLYVAPLDEVAIQPELKDVVAFLKANGARPHYGHLPSPHYFRFQALLMRSKALDRKENAWLRESE